MIFLKTIYSAITAWWLLDGKGRALQIKRCGSEGFGLRVPWGSPHFNLIAYVFFFWNPEYIGIHCTCTVPTSTVPKLQRFSVVIRFFTCHGCKCCFKFIFIVVVRIFQILLKKLYRWYTINIHCTLLYYFGLFCLE